MTLTGSADDNLGLEKVEIKLPGESNWNAVTGTSLWSYQIANDEVKTVEELYEITKPSIANKTYTIRATDKAGNYKEESITLNIDPASDYPVVSIMMPKDDDTKVSGILSVMCTIDDDDYPLKDMSAKLWLKKVDGGTTVAGYPKIFNKTVPGFPNIITTIDTEELVDMAQYRIEIEGYGWKNKTSNLISKTFWVDKNVPIIELDNDSVKNNEYKTNAIRINGKVKDKGQLAATNKLILSTTTKKVIKNML